MKDKKQFALEQIAPYFKNPDLCGFDDELSECVYETKDGKMCVAGKCMTPKARMEYIGVSTSIYAIINRSSQDKIFKKDFVDVLTKEEWNELQCLHDAIANEYNLQKAIDKLGLFTYEELVEYSKNPDR